MKRNPFTLIELVVALAILGLGVVSYLTVANAAQRRLARAQERWTRFHMLSQAAEFYLLQTADDPEDPGPDFFDYPGYQTECRYEDVTDLPEELVGISDDQAELRGCRIELIRINDGAIVDAVTVDRVNYEQ